MSNSEDNYIPPEKPKIPEKLKKMAVTLLGTALRTIVDGYLQQGAQYMGVTHEDVDEASKELNKSKDLIVEAEFKRSDGR